LVYGNALATIGRPEEGLPYISAAVQNRRRNRPGTRYLGQMLEEQALVLIDLGRYNEAERLFHEADEIRDKIGQKPDAKYAAPRLKLALATSNTDRANDLIERFYGSVSDAASLTIDLLRNLAARAELALLRNDGRTAAQLAHRLSGQIESSH